VNVGNLGSSVVSLVTLLLLALRLQASASTVFGPWVPLFKGIDHAVGTNTPDGSGFAELQVVNALRVDLTDPDVRFFSTPRYSNYIPDGTGTCGYETAVLTATNFLRTYNLQVAINANNFHDPCTADSPSYTLAEGTPVRVTGALVSTGQVVSVQEGAVDDSSFLFTSNNVATFVPTNWPPAPTGGAYTVVSGLYAVLVNGVNVAYNYLGNPDFVHGLNPRTAYGLSQDRHYLYLVTIDGRQSGYSDGAYDWETAEWLKIVGAWDGANMDGGGSTCMVALDSTGAPVELNHDSAAAGNNIERTVGCHLGIFAKPVPGFINDVTPMPDDTAATITWTTTAPSTSQVQYGLTTDLGSGSALSTDLVTNHSVLLTNLTPGTGYYFIAVSTSGGNQYVSSNFFFVTTNYVITTSIFDLTNTWTYGTANLDGLNWTAPSYNDSGWDGSGPGLLWIDIRGPNTNITEPLMTQMPGDPNNSYSAGYPYTTYYFRTHFPFTNSLSGVSLLFTDYIDDGAVFYLNGVEIYRLRMPTAPTPIYNATLAAGYACSGDATCPDFFTISGDLTTNLLVGDNVLAAEVHNYNVGSPDITFGTALSFTEPYTLSPKLNLSNSNSLITLSWSRGGFTLQQAGTPTGPWTNTPGPVVASPYTPAITAPVLYYRLIK
jgi:hypothetical protein